MTLDEKIGQLNMFHWPWTVQDDSFKTVYEQMIREGKIGSFLGIYGVDRTLELQKIAVEQSRLGIPLLFAFDVIHGWKTTFPVPLAEACSWDLEMIEKTARVAAIEATSSGIHWTFAPMVDIARDPRWGRVVEGSGEDPFLGSMIAAARVKGFQGDKLDDENTLLACAKHFTAYGGAEGGRDYNTVDISERTLFEVYLPPFQASVNAGVSTIMGAFNEIAGLPMHANERLLTTVLRKEWGFDGLVVSDWTAIKELQAHGVASDPAEACRLALQAGVDVDMVSGIYLRHLPEMVREGKISEDLINQAARRVLKAKHNLGLFNDPYKYHNVQKEQDASLTSQNIQLALQMARKSIVLLKNSDNILPLKKDIKSLAVIGALAKDRISPLGAWSGIGDSSIVVSVWEGIKRAVSPKTKLVFRAAYDSKGFVKSNEFQEAAELARKCETVIVVLGEPSLMSGEAASRSDIGLPGDQVRLLELLNKNTKSLVVILMNGRPLALEGIAEQISTILESWNLGIQMGNAVADVIFGDYNPSGKLPVTFPRTTGQIPIYYNHKKTGRPPDINDHYTSKYIDLAWTPLFPFGYGLSYTSYSYNDIFCSRSSITSKDSLLVSVRVTNTGQREGDEIIQLYIQDVSASITRPLKELKGFRTVHLRPAESQKVDFLITPEMLSFYDQRMRKIVEPGLFKIFIGGNSVNTIEQIFEVVN
jgi:beta-glucosidase